MNSTNYTFAPILNPFLLIDCDSVEILPGLEIARATDEQVKRIRNLILGYTPTHGVHTIPNYESRMVEYETASGKHGKFEPLPRSEWRYNVVNITGSMDKLEKVEIASIVSELQIEVPIVLLHDGSLGYAARASHFCANCPLHSDWPRVGPPVLKDIAASYEEMMAVREDFPEIARALSILNDMRLLPRNSDFEVLGLFSVIEMLITHNPKLKDVGDSITHQMTGKIPLLSKRFIRPLDYSVFGDASEEKVWSRLYAYRSRLAHGGEANFDVGDLLVLRSRWHAVTFLGRAVRALVRHSFKEPQLLRDLKGV